MRVRDTAKFPLAHPQLKYLNETGREGEKKRRTWRGGRRERRTHHHYILRVIHGK